MKNGGKCNGSELVTLDMMMQMLIGDAVKERCYGIWPKYEIPCLRD